MATKHACWTSASSTDGGEGITLQSSQEHDEGNISIKEEGEVGKETCLSIPGSKGLRYEGQLVTHDGLVFTIKQEVDTDMFESLSSTEGQDPSTEQEIVYAIIKQEDKEEIFEPITPHGEGGGETEQSIPEELDNGQDNIHPHITACSGEETHLCLHCKLDNGQDNIHPHITACSGEETHLCLHCSKTFTDENTLILHRKTHQVDYELTSHLGTHTGEKAFKYSQCDKDKGFSHRRTLNSHLRTHSGEKPFNCSQCDKGFSHKSTLRRHFRTHSGEKPYQCSYCDKTFAQLINLTRHLRRHTGEKPFKCSQCDKGFSHKTSLNQHLRSQSLTEKPLQCFHCDKSFSQRCHFTRHLRTHDGEKPFKCSHCNKGFFQSSTLISHLRTHMY
ncbi:gastrula zinc finger protein XlCGF8.2DB isoform X6 [Strongylocentrotus purpuratus]|uniref:C2H2-type domain-containing protein n=1 Tax=Strongylocentrotus purpuratus TaxID=7668 RepID=A0A7M7PE73_STRPU|nr:gastrula zinc finger protein XlCGF8.2DB isoform X6 [Strongylocentrotus purpuratus]